MAFIMILSNVIAKSFEISAVMNVFHEYVNFNLFSLECVIVFQRSSRALLHFSVAALGVQFMISMKI